MILICGGVADPITELVCARLDDCGYPYRLLDLGVYPDGYEVSWHWVEASPTGYIAGSNWQLGLQELTGVYARYPGSEWRLANQAVPKELVPAIYAECDAGLTALLEYLPCPVVNRLAGGMSNHSKPYQSLVIRENGLLIPPTLVTNDPEAARQFVSEYQGDVVYKSLSSVRSIVRRVGSDSLKRLPMLRHGPAQFQRFIPGNNVRVHTVGDELFATLVRTEAVDYRYAEGVSVELEPTQLPSDVATACMGLARRLGLLLSGIDLKLTPDGDWYCFEVNPAPAFLFYEKATGQPISTALANLLMNG